MAPPPRRPTKTGEAVAADIRRRIASGELRIGDRLPSEEELTEQLGIARTTLRESLRILESQGLVSIKRGRGGGPVVTMPDLDRLSEPLAVVLQLRGTTAKDLDEARRLMEPYFAGWLATHHTDDDLAVLHAAVDAATRAADLVDRVGFGEAATTIHETLVLRGGNRTMTVIAQLLHRMVLDRYTRAAALADQAQLQRARRSYAKLVELIARGDAAAATEHWIRQLDWMLTESEDQPLDIVDVPTPRKPSSPRTRPAARK